MTNSHTPRSDDTQIKPKALQDFPAELLVKILDLFPIHELYAVNLTSKRLNKIAQPAIWRDVELVDCRVHTSPHTGHRTVTSGSITATHTGNRIPAGATVGAETDEHDDTPLIRKLIVLATNPNIAASVQTLTHRCHLPPPALFTELERTPFTAQTLSIDPRTICLVRMAVKANASQHMTNVQTLQIVFGHPRLSEALLRCFFDQDRPTKIKHLWMENMRILEGTEIEIQNHKYGLPKRLSFQGLKSLRFRRLPLETVHQAYGQNALNPALFNHARGNRSTELQNGLGGQYLTNTVAVGAELVSGQEQVEQTMELTESSGEPVPFENLMGPAHKFDDAIYAAISHEVALPAEVLAAAEPSHHRRSILAYQAPWYLPVQEFLPEEARMFRHLFRANGPTAGKTALALLSSAKDTLTSLTLDWAMTAPKESSMNREDYEGWLRWYVQLFDLRFPSLQVFQYRNAIVDKSMLPCGLFLLDHSNLSSADYPEKRSLTDQPRSTVFDMGLKPLEFIEAHPKLKCLAWPMDQFFAPHPRRDIGGRVQMVISRLSTMLVDLRVDACYFGMGEPHSDDYPPGQETEDTLSRRRFIAEFAAEMRTVTSIKIEGGIPLDERRETIRALRHCKLEKIVFIGTCSTIGNTWGADGTDGTLTDDERDFLEEEDEAAIKEHIARAPAPPDLSLPFRPEYGWNGRPPMTYTIAAYHGASIRELKFCGYKGAPNLFDPPPLAEMLLKPLLRFPRLEALTLSLKLDTSHGNATHDDSVIASWLAPRNAATTALVAAPGSAPPGSWAHQLEYFEPEYLAWTAVWFAEEFLSPEARRQPGGVRFRASFCMGDWGGIFDLDVWVGCGGSGRAVLLGFEGPREESEDGRRREKLVGRRWFGNGLRVGG